jgi:hypothetical protein
MKHYYTRRVGGKKIVCAKTPQGQGMFTFGEDPRRTIKRAMMMRGNGMGPHGAGFFEDLGKAIKTGTKAVEKFVKAPATKAVIKKVRQVGSPFVKKGVEKGIQALPGLLAMNPKTAALAPVAQMAGPMATKGILKGLEMGEAQAEKAGYGPMFPGDATRIPRGPIGRKIRPNERRLPAYLASKMGRGLYDVAPKGGAIQRNDGLKYKRNQFGKYNQRKTITQETIKKVPHLAIGARVSGHGLKPL